MIAEKPWRTESVLRLFLGILMTISVGFALAGVLQADWIKMTENHREIAQMAMMAVFFHGGILVWIGVFLRETPMLWSEAFGLAAPRRGKAVLLGALGAVLFLPFAWGMQGLLAGLIEWLTRHPAVQQEVVTVLQKGNSPRGEQVFVAVLAVLVAPVAEEMLFRGIVYPTLKQGGHPRAAWWLTSLLFAAMHFNALSFLPLTVFSMILIYLYEKTGSLWASITAHSLFNFANFLFMLLTAGDHPIIPSR